MANAINEFYTDELVSEGLGITKSLSAKIGGHALGYRGSKLLQQLENDKNNRMLSYSLLSPVATIGISKLGRADIGGDPAAERLLWNLIGGEYDKKEPE